MEYERVGITPEEVLYYIGLWMEHDPAAALANLEEVKRIETEKP